MSTTTQRLEKLCKDNPKFLRKGGLCVALLVTRIAKQRGLPLDPESLRTEEGGQVAGLGKASVQKILEDHGITRVLAEEGGRTSRGSLGLMETYVRTLNELNSERNVDLMKAEAWWIQRVRLHFASSGPRFHFDPGKSLRVNVEDLLLQVQQMQAGSGGANYLGAMLQHLVGAKLDLVLGQGIVGHYGSSVADQSTERHGDFQVDAVAIHVTTNPTEALVRKCAANLQAALKPVILTLGKGVDVAADLLNKSDLSERVDILDAAQFLTANIHERSLFQAKEYKLTLSKLLHRYNEIVSACETDPALQIHFSKSSSD